MLLCHVFGIKFSMIVYVWTIKKKWEKILCAAVLVNIPAVLTDMSNYTYAWLWREIMRTQSMAPKLESRILRWLFILIMEPKSSWIRIYIIKESNIQGKCLNISSLKPTIKAWSRITLYNVILRIPRNFLETREIVKISTHPFYHTNLDWFS